VEVGSTLPRIPQIERTQLLALLQVLAQFPHLNDVSGDDEAFSRPPPD
jgi:hypothetical protein